MTNLNVCYTDYDYDAAGNRIYANYSSAGGDYEIDYTYDKNNRLIKGRQYGEGSENNRITTYGYDKNGNRISKKYYNNYPYSSQKTILKIEDYRSKLTTDAESYIYDGFNRLTQISTEGDNVYKYAYYPNGLRMYKDVNGAMTYFQWDGDNIWGLAANVSNGLTHYYYRGLDGVIKENYGAVYVYNGHGDVVKMTNSNGAVTKDYEYDAFGVIEDENAADINPWRYCGEYYDTETGNIYLRARYYDPSIGSFITEDPARDGTNWYSYCAGNPVSYIDPSGMILKILGSQQFTDDMVGYLTELTNYTFKTVAMEESEGVFVMLDGFNDNELNYVYSNQLVKGIIGNGKICTIYESYSETNQVDYANKDEYGDLEEIYAENRYNGIGMSADVYINPTNFTQHYLGERLNENGLWESQLENEPNPMIILAHELIHAQRVMQGRAIDHIYGSAVYGYLDINKSNDDPQYESAYYEELVTIGLIDFGNQPINENSIRSEHGLNIRSVYSLN